MAKVTKIIATLVGSSALWLGGTAYISSNTQSELNNYVTKANKLYESNGMKLSVESFEKGFFTSTAKMKIDFMDSPIKEAVAKTFKLPMVMDYNIENGPLFFKEGFSVVRVVLQPISTLMIMLLTKRSSVNSLKMVLSLLLVAVLAFQKTLRL